MVRIREAKIGLKDDLPNKTGPAKAKYSFKRRISKIKTLAKKSIRRLLISRGLTMEFRVKVKTLKLKIFLTKNQTPCLVRHHQLS